MADASPLDATYYANLAALNFQKENALASDKRGREQTNAQSAYSKGQLTRTEPLRLQGNRSTANSQGLLESGQLAQRQGQTQTEYASKQSRIGEQRKQAIERYNEGDSKANQSYLLGTQKAEAESFQRAKEQTERNPPPPETPTPTTAGPPQPPQVAGIKAQPNSGAIRRQAAKKATGLRSKTGWGGVG